MLSVLSPGWVCLLRHGVPSNAWDGAHPSLAALLEPTPGGERSTKQEQPLGFAGPPIRNRPELAKGKSRLSRTRAAQCACSAIPKAAKTC